MRFAPLAGAFLALISLGSPAVAGAQHSANAAVSAQRTDPQASSPAGVIYQIPLDAGRREAAPVTTGLHGGGGGGAAGGGAGGGGSAGGAGGGGGGGPSAASSSHGAGGSTVDASSSRLPGGVSPTDPSSIHSENGFGSSSDVPGLTAAAADTGAGVAATHPPSSTFPTYLLILLIAVAATVVGVFASRATRPGEPAGAAAEAARGGTEPRRQLPPVPNRPPAGA